MNEILISLKTVLCNLLSKRNIIHKDIYTIFGTKMYLHQEEDQWISKVLSSNYHYELNETMLLKNYIKPNMTVVDIGANIGYYTALFSKWTGPYGKVFAIEPEPNNIKLLKKNILANNCKNVEIFELALSDKRDIVDLWLNEENKGDHRIIKYYLHSFDNERKKIKVKCEKLDSLIPRNIKVGLIKMDIQGSEMLALRGMTSILTQNKPLYILTEFFPYALEHSNHKAKDLIELLSSLGFEIFVIDHNDGSLKKFDKNDRILTNYSKHEQVNLFCKKE